MRNGIGALLHRFGLDAIYGIDFETFYDSKEYTLRKLSTTEYIVDPRFEVMCVSVQRHDAARPQVLDHDAFVTWCKAVRKQRIGMLAHHAHFDGLILSHHFGLHPAMYFDTLSLAQPIMPIQVSRGLDSLAKAFGLKGKVRRAALDDVDGKHWSGLTAAQRKRLMSYAGDDIADTWRLFKRLSKYTSDSELRLIDLTVKMYAQPTLLADFATADGVHRGEVEKKATLLARLGFDAKDFTSDARFAALLEAAGAPVPVKENKRGETAYAFAKTDPAFKALLKHEDKRVRELVAARLALKTNTVENRSAKVASRSALGAQPVYLNYAKAKTWRWSGGDKMNYQNLDKGSGLREALRAPEGHLLIIADQGQIEARLNNWRCGQQDELEAFAQDKDVYALAATHIFGYEVHKDTHARERFVGKVATLALGYGMGPNKFRDRLAGDEFNPMEIGLDHAKMWVQSWRAAHPMIVAGWARDNSDMLSAFFGGKGIDRGILRFEGVEDRSKGFIHLPGGVTMRYDGLQANEAGEPTYVSRYRANIKTSPTIERTKLYGGLICENITQCLGRILLGGQIVQMYERMPKARLAMTTHDEVVYVVPKRFAETYRRAVVEVMTHAPDWASGLPLKVDAHISDRYDK